jgi:hypothetical protein
VGYCRGISGRYSGNGRGLKKYVELSEDNDATVTIWLRLKINFQLPSTAAEQARYIVVNNLAIQYGKLSINLNFRG